jgi:hypothetical protein
MSMKGTRSRDLIVSMTCSNCAGARSQPVGLWQQACRTTMVPAGAAARRAIISPNAMPRVEAS